MPDIPSSLNVAMIIATFKDEGISGTFGREVRAQYDTMLKQGVQAKFDVVLAWDVSRLSRSLIELVATLDELHACGIDQYHKREVHLMWLRVQ